VPRDHSSRQLQPLTVLVPLEHRVSAQRIADSRFISLADLIREALAEKLDRERREHADAR
jgi:hypothetical protein